MSFWISVLNVFRTLFEYFNILAYIFVNKRNKELLNL